MDPHELYLRKAKENLCWAIEAHAAGARNVAASRYYYAAFLGMRALFESRGEALPYDERRGRAEWNHLTVRRVSLSYNRAWPASLVRLREHRVAADYLDHDVDAHGVVESDSLAKGLLSGVEAWMKMEPSHG